jgi:phosphoribosylaminoimidazole-succinocarboxamide synthase
MTISRYARKDYFVHSLQKITALPDPIFKKLAKIQQHYVHITHTAFHPHRTINVESVDIKSELRAAFTTYIIKKTAIAQQHCVQIITNFAKIAEGIRKVWIEFHYALT